MKKFLAVCMTLALIYCVFAMPARASGDNLITNGSFTYSTVGWSNLSNAGASRQNSVAYNGYALKINATSGTYFYNSNISVTAGETYQLSFRIRVENADGLSFSTFLNDHPSSATWWKDFVTTPVSAECDWTLVSGIVTVPQSAGSTLQLGFKTYAGSGTVFLDEISLCRIQISDTPNLDFETASSSTGAPENWQLDTGRSNTAWTESDTAVYHSGGQSLHLYKDSLAEKTTLTSPVFIPVTEDVVYEWSFWMAAQNCSPAATLKMNLLAYDASGQRLYIDGAAQTVTGTTCTLNSGDSHSDWTKVITRSAVPAGTAYVSICFELTQGVVELWLDDLCLHIVENDADCVIWREDFHALDESGQVNCWQTENGSLSAGGVFTAEAAGCMYTPLEGLETGCGYNLEGTCSASVSGTVTLRFYDYTHKSYTAESVTLLQGQKTVDLSFTAPSCTFAELWICTDGGGAVTLDSLTLRRTAEAPLPEKNNTDPSWSATTDRDNVVSSVEVCNGVPTLMIDGVPTAAYFYQRPDLDAYLETDAESRIEQSELELYVTYGGNLYKGGCDPIWLEDGSIDYDAFDAVIYDTLAASDNALVMVNIGMFAPKWWLEENPDHEAMSSDGENLTPLGDASFASEKFREEAGEILRQLIRHMKEQNYYNRVFGLKISGGQSYEWMCLGTDSNQGPDYSPASQEGFKTYLKNKYGTVEALQQAWGDDTVTFDTAAAPDWDERTSFANVYMGDADTGALARNIIDWNLWLNEASADSFLYYCQIAREETDGQIIVGGYNGYLWTSNTYDSQGMAHTAMERVLDSEYVDWIASPVAYNERLLGESSTYMPLLDSVQEHGKLYIAEQDNRTCLAEGYAGISWDAKWDYQVGQTHTMADTIYQQKRDFANALVNGAGLWQYDMYGGWLDDEQLYDFFRDAKAEYDVSLQLDRNVRNEVAVFVGDETYAYFTAGGSNMPYTVFAPLLQQQRKHLAAMGAGYDTYAMSSLLDGKVTDHKLNIILSPFEITEQMQQAIDTYLKKDGQVVVWVYLPGISDGTTLDVANIEKTTGFTVGVTQEKSTLQVQLIDAGHTLTKGIAGLIYGGNTYNASSPLTYIADTAGAEILGYNTDGDNAPGLGVKDMGDWISVYSAAPCLDVALLRNLLDLADCHIYSDSNADVIYSSNSYVALHSATAGEKTVWLPCNYAVYDVFEEEYVAMDTNCFTYYHVAGDTHIFRLTAPQTYTVSLQAGANGQVTGFESGAVTPGAEISLTVTPDAGYVVEAVTVNGILQELNAAGGSLTLTIQENTVIKVQFDKWRLIENGDFETGAFTGDVTASGAAIDQDDRVYSGSYSLDMNYEDGVRDLVEITLYPNASDEDRTVQISFYARTKTSTSKKTLSTARYCFEEDWTKTSITYGAIYPTTSWKKFTETVVLPAGSGIFQYLLYTGDTGIGFYVDDISIVCDGREMMINGGMERGNLGGSFTRIENTPTVVTQNIAHSGHYAACLAQGDTVTAAAGDLNLTKATPLTLSAWLQGAVDYTVTALSADGAQLAAFSDSFEAAEGWCELELSFGVPEGTDEIHILFTAQDDVWLDDISLCVTAPQKSDLRFMEIYTDGTWRVTATNMELFTAQYYKIPVILDGVSGYVVGSVTGDFISIYPSFFGVYGGEVPTVSFEIPEDALLIPVTDTLNWGAVPGGIPLAAESVAVTLKTAEISAWNVTLGGDLQVNFYADIQADDISQVKATVTAGGNTESCALSAYDEELQAYILSVHIAAAQMTDKICVRIYSGAVTLVEKTCTVREYAEYVLQQAEFSAHHALVTQMLCYGGAAQRYFDYNADAPADADITCETAAVPQEWETPEVTGTASGIAFYGASMLFRDQFGVRFYFTADSADGYTFTVDGETCVPGQKNGMLYVEITDILPQKLQQTLTVTVSDGADSITVCYSPMCYMVRMSQKGTEKMKALMLAVYNYHLAAAALTSMN